MDQIKKMGNIGDMLSMIPGGNKLAGMQADEKQMARTEAIIKSMTPGERRNPSIIGGSRKKRIARGSGTQVQDVNRLLSQFEQMTKLVKTMAKRGKGGMMKLPF
jgi:signal recognition particle subunit SRP54